jgi:hypothetical protein
MDSGKSALLNDIHFKTIAILDVPAIEVAINLQIRKDCSLCHTGQRHGSHSAQSVGEALPR